MEQLPVIDTSGGWSVGWSDGKHNFFNFFFQTCNSLEKLTLYVVSNMQKFQRLGV